MASLSLLTTSGVTGSAAAPGGRSWRTRVRCDGGTGVIATRGPRDGPVAAQAVRRSAPARLRSAHPLRRVARLAKHDRKTRGHAERVRALTDLLAERMSLPQGDRDRLRWAALLHDIGKLNIAGSLLNKDGKPNAQEWEIIRRHPEHGAQIA